MEANQQARAGFPAPTAEGTCPTRGYERFRVFLENACGISLGEGKAYLVESRLRGTMIDLGLDSLEELVARASGAGEAALRQRILDAMTTNETLWFRDEHPFDTLRENLLPELDGANAHLRIWSAGCSTGQEPYSISMVIDELERATFRRLASSVEIIATDLAPSALDHARTGVYGEPALRRGVDVARKRLFFEPHADGWRVVERVRRRVTFAQVNLLDSYTMLGRFDIVFCRNVLIYFAVERRLDILERIGAVLAPGGFLVLGGTESVPGNVTRFERCRNVRGPVYRRAR